MKKTIMRAGLASLVGVCTLLYACEPKEIGYLSDEIYYRVNPFLASKGQTVYSAPLELDGSSSPMTVRLLAVRHKESGLSADSLLKTFDVQQYSSAITRDDSTLELLNKKIIVKPEQVLRINPLGGRIEVTSASSNVALGTYTFDIEVSNSRGTRQLKNACDVVITGAARADYTLMDGSFYTTSDVSGETNFSGRYTPQVTAQRIVNGQNRIILKYVDKNGVPFNPAKGEIVNRGDRGNFAQMNPYYKEVKTDTAMVWQFPVLQAGFPAFGGNNGDLIYYRIPGRFTDVNSNVNPVLGGIRVYSPGTYIITFKLPTISRKP